MKVFFLINTLGGGGAEKQLLLTATALARRGHDCVIHTLRWQPLSGRMETMYEEARAAGVDWEAPTAAARLPWRQVLALRRQLRRDSGALLWSWGHRADLAALGLRLLGVRFAWICSLRDADDARMMRHRWLWRLIDRFASGYASNTRRGLETLDHITGNTHQKGALIMNAMGPREQARETCRPVDRPARLRVVMLGNILIHKKGYDLATTLAARICDAGLPFSLHLGGAPVEAEKLRQLAENAGVAETLRMEGRVDAPLAFLDGGDVFLMLSRYEGTPNALLEAMSLGLPAICTRVGDVATFARDREHLRLVEIEDVEGAFQALRDLWENWPEALAMGRRGQELCHGVFTMERMTADTLALLSRFQPEGAR